MIDICSEDSIRDVEGPYTSIIDELEESFRSGSEIKRLDMLRKVADLFFENPALWNGQGRTMGLSSAPPEQAGKPGDSEFKQWLGPGDGLRTVPIEKLVRQLSQHGKLNDQAILGFLAHRKIVEISASLALLGGVPTSTILRLLGGPADLVLIVCKAGGLAWQTAEAILYKGFAGIADTTMSVARANYQKLSQPTAQRTIRFIQIRDKAARQDRESVAAPERSM